MEKSDKKKKPSVKSLAQATGLSVATISRVLNKSESVQSKTRDRVLAAMEEHGYVMNSAARALSTNRTRTIGAVVPTLSHSIFAKFLNTIEQSLADKGYMLVVATCDGDINTENKRARELLDLGTEGLILSGNKHDETLIKTTQDRQIPVIFTSVSDTGINIPAIGYDNSALAEDAIDYLVNQGHKNIHIVHSPADDNDRIAMRLSGVEKAANKQNIRVTYSCVSLDVAGGTEAASNFINQAESASACLCMSDILALGMLFEFNRRGVSVPEQISIMGFDDLDWAAHSHPKLTTIGLPTLSMGEHTANTIVDYLDKQIPMENIKLEANIIERETVKRL